MNRWLMLSHKIDFAWDFAIMLALKRSAYLYVFSPCWSPLGSDMLQSLNNTLKLQHIQNPPKYNLWQNEFDAEQLNIQLQR